MAEGKNAKQQKKKNYNKKLQKKHEISAKYTTTTKHDIKKETTQIIRKKQ